MDRQSNHSGSDVSDAMSDIDVTVIQVRRPSTRALDDANKAINALGPKARLMIPPSMTAQFGEWLGWPLWFNQGTSVAAGEPLPSRISVEEDLIVLSNIIDFGKGGWILSRIQEDFRILGGSSAAPALYNAPCLRDAMALYARAASVGTPYVRSVLRDDNPCFELTIESTVPNGELLEFIALTFFLMARKFVTFFISHDLEKMKIQVPSNCTGNLASLLTGTSDQLMKAGEHFVLTGESQWLDAKNLRADPAFWHFAIERINAVERERQTSEVIQRVRTAVCTAMQTANRVPRLKQIAAEERVSERTLVRALAAHGTSFHKIVEDERRAIASELIGNTSISLGEIAKSLGFTDMSSFGRSFRQWYGMTPGQARMRQTD